MPADKKVSESSQGNLSRDKRGLQKSTTDSEGKERHANIQKQEKAKKPVKQPKIKPNYGTKAGGM